MSRSFAIVVHAGAGDHGTDHEREIVRTMKESMLAAKRTLLDGSDCMEFVTSAVMRLEDCPLTNAGVGSSLNADGVAECDAAVVDGSDPAAFGVVSGLRGRKNPVLAAKRLRDLRVNWDGAFGLVAPGILAGEGANAFCQQHEIPAADLETPRTRRLWRKYAKRAGLLKDNETVGAVGIAGAEGSACAAASSGGSWLKHAGRVGAAGVLGAASYASGRRAVAASGQGEGLVSRFAARQLVQLLESDDLDGAAAVLAEEDAGAVGIDAVSDDDTCAVVWLHTSRTMALGYFSSQMEKPVAFISRIPCNLSAVKLDL